MPANDAFFYAPAREFYEDEASGDEQEAIDRIIRNICDNPGIDHQVKFYFPVPPAVFNLYADGEWWVVYHQRGNLAIGVLNIGRGRRSKARYGSEPR
jgi:hypothetical protein